MPIQSTPGRELIVVANSEISLRASPRGVESLTGHPVAEITDALNAAAAVISPLFATREEKLAAASTAIARASGFDVPKLWNYYRVHAADDRLDALAAVLAASAGVAAAYVKPPVYPPALNEMVARVPEAPPSTPDFSSRQGYLDAAPGGVDARYAWMFPGGRGSGVRIIDVEGAWNFLHEDLVANQGGVVGGTPTTDLGWVNHGTAVLGVFSGDGVGVKGICPDADVSAISLFGLSSASAIHQAADRLGTGDIILVELHRAGPRYNFEDRPDQLGFIPIEWWPDDFDAIRYATAKGIIVVAAAGNGGENLDDALYDMAPGGFPAAWSNPFRRGTRDSGSILVGAGAPPPGTHGSAGDVDRSRLVFSNWGSAIDTQGWGLEVTTTGYGDLQGGSSMNAWYTDRFSGTSSASPIVVGALGCVQGALRASGTPLVPAEMRSMLRTTGSPQQDGAQFPATEHIGARPNIRQMLDATSVETDVPAPMHRYWSAPLFDHFFTTNWAELGPGNADWAYEAVAFRVHLSAVPGTTPLYRYFNAQVGDHMYTTDFSELGAGKFGWLYEGVAGYVHAQASSQTIPLYRYWNATGGDHFYTIDWSELGNGKLGWVFENVACYVHPSVPSR